MRKDTLLTTIVSAVFYIVLSSLFKLNILWGIGLFVISHWCYGAYKNYIIGEQHPLLDLKNLSIDAVNELYDEIRKNKKI